METIFIGADHAGFELKEKLKEFLKELSYKVEDMGNTKYDKDDDYPDYAVKVAKKVAEGGKGVLACGSGHGMCITANKVKGVRAALVKDLNDAKLSREHNNSNVICLSGWKADLESLKEILKTWLDTSFSEGERHHRRVDKIKKIENEM